MAETPIGSIEFLVKFDTIGREFSDALKEAVEKADIGVGGVSQDITNDIKAIKYNLESRLKTGYTGDRRQFLASAPGDISSMLTDDFLIEMTEVLMGSKTGKRIFPSHKGEDPDKYLERITETSKRLILSYVHKVEKQMDKPTPQGMSELMTLQPAFQAAIKGRWKYLTEPIVEKLLDETDWQTLMEYKLREMGITTREEGQGQLMWQKTLENIGGGTNVIQTMGELMKGLMDVGLSEQQAKDIYMGVQKYTPSIKDKMKEFYDQNLIMAGANVPGPMLHTMKRLGLIEKEAWTTAGGIKPDLPYIIGREFWKDPSNKKSFLDLWDDEETKDKLKEQIDEALKESEFIAFVMEGKNIVNYVKFLYEKFKGRGGPFFQMGGVGGGGIEGVPVSTGPGNIPFYKAKTMEEIKQMGITNQMRHMTELIVDLKAGIEGIPPEMADEFKKQIEPIVNPPKNPSRE